jgi:hypothetical protein
MGCTDLRSQCRDGAASVSDANFIAEAGANITVSSQLYGINSAIESTTGGTIDDPDLQTLSFTNLTYDGTGTLATSQMTGIQFGSIDITGGDPAFTNLADIDGSSVDVSGGATVGLPAVAGYTDPTAIGYYVPTLEATGPGSSLSLANMTSLTVNNASSVPIEALSGGQIDLPDLTLVNTGNVLLESTGAGSVLKLSDLTTLAETNTGFFDRSSLSILQSTSNGTIVDPVLASLTYTDLIDDGTGTITTNQLTTVTDGSIDISGGAPSFSALTDVDGSSINDSGGVAQGQRIKLHQDYSVGTCFGQVYKT